MNRPDSQVPVQGRGTSQPQYPMQQGPEGFQHYPQPPPRRKSLKDALVVIPAGMYMIFSILVSIFLILLFLSLLGYIMEFVAIIMCGFLIITVFAGIYYLLQSNPTPNYGSQFSLNMVKDASEKGKGGSHGTPQYPPQEYKDKQPPPPPSPPPPLYNKESSEPQYRPPLPPEY